MLCTDQAYPRTKCKSAKNFAERARDSALPPAHPTIRHHIEMPWANEAAPLKGKGSADRFTPATKFND